MPTARLADQGDLAPSPRERFFLVALPLFALAMAGVVVYCGLAMMLALGPAAV